MLVVAIESAFCTVTLTFVPAVVCVVPAVAAGVNVIGKPGIR